MDRREALALLQKATIDTSVGGQLNDSQSDAFVQEVMQKSAFGSAIRHERRRAPKGTIDKMGNGSRLLRGHEENTDDGYRAGVNTSEVPYDANELWLPWEVTRNFQHENLEGASVEAKIVSRMSRQFALDLDDLDISGDEESENAFLKLDDGVVKLAENSEKTHHVEGAKVKDDEGNELAGAMDIALFFAVAFAMPDKYVNSGRLRWLMSPNRWLTWIKWLTDRETGAGDAAISNRATFPLGIPPFMGASADDSEVMPGVPFWPDDLIMLVDLQNFVRVITWDIERYTVRAGQDWELTTRRKDGHVIFIKKDIVIEEDDAVAYVDGLSEITA